METFKPGDDEYVDPLSPEVEAGLDPGVRDLVVKLRQCGWDTCDSGDGESKFTVDDELAEALRYKHVICEIGPIDVFAAADQFEALCQQFTGSDKWYVELTYSTKDNRYFLVAIEDNE